MKTLLLSLPLLTLISCAGIDVTGGPNPRARILNGGATQSFDELRVGDIIITGYKSDGVEGFKAALTAGQKALNSWMMLKGMSYIAGKYYDNQAKEITGAQATKMQEVANQKSAADAAAKLEELKFVTEAEAAKPAVQAATGVLQ